MSDAARFGLLRKALLGIGFASSLALLVGPGCVAAANDGDDDGEDVASGDDAISGDDAVSRAMEWVNAKLHYCQSPNGDRDYDSACSPYCHRKHDKAWDPYRSDCSGLVSWAWKVPAPGRTTYGFAPYDDSVTHEIKAIDLEPGDAVNNEDHVMLFKHWDTKGKSATFIEEPGCSVSEPYAREWSSKVSINGNSIYVDFNGMTFHAIRYNKVTHNEPAPKKEKAPDKPKDCGRLHVGEGLVKGESVESCDGRFKLILQHDDNLVLYERKNGEEKALWATHTNDKKPFDVRMQSDGNLVMYNENADPLWATHTSGNKDSHVSIQNDGNLVIYNKNDKAIWASDTCCH